MYLNKLDNIYIPDIMLMERDSESSHYIMPYSEERHNKEIINPLNRYLGIFDDNNLLGFIILGIEESGRRIEFRRIVVKIKGKGTGQKALIELEKYCKVTWNTEKIWLDVFEDNLRGIYIYEKFGYQLLEATKHEGRNLLIMEKTLS